jgi:hypothetical protein
VGRSQLLLRTATLAVTGAETSDLQLAAVPFLSCSFPFWHLLTKGEKSKIESIF